MRCENFVSDTTLFTGLLVHILTRGDESCDISPHWMRILGSERLQKVHRIDLLTGFVCILRKIVAKISIKQTEVREGGCDHEESCKKRLPSCRCERRDRFRARCTFLQMVEDKASELPQLRRRPNQPAAWSPAEQQLLSPSS